MNEAGSLAASSDFSIGAADENEKDAVVSLGLDCSGVETGVADAKLNPGTGFAAGELLATEGCPEAFVVANLTSMEGDGLLALGELVGFFFANAEKPPIAGFAASWPVFSSSLVPADGLNDPLGTVLATSDVAFASDALVKGAVVGAILVFLLASPVLSLTFATFRVTGAGVDSTESTGGARFARGVYRKGSRFTEDGRPVRGIRPMGVPERLTLRWSTDLGLDG